jgi:arabinan endo-1,5-alpha-L-arabinosidase
LFGSHIMPDHFKSPDIVTLFAPIGTPYHFTINIQGTAFTITGEDPFNGLEKTYSLVLNQRNHQAYTELFSNLSEEFGLRMPFNTEQEVAGDDQINYHELLTRNLAAGMLYGYGDPAVLRVDNASGTWYYVVSTSNDAPDSFPIIRSKDLKKWEFTGFVFPAGGKPMWAADGEFSDYWAPEMHYVENEFRVYFVARHKDTRELCIGMARSINPEGPFTCHDEPVLKGNVIDAHLFTEEDNTYLLWKEDNNDVWPAKLLTFLYENPAVISELFANVGDRITASFMVTLWPWLRKLEPMERFLSTQIFIESIISDFGAYYQSLQTISSRYPAVGSVLPYMKTPVYIQKLLSDGITLTGERIKLLENDLDWEAHLVEGVWISHYDNRYYLFYAGNDFSTHQYGIGVAVADNLLGPYIKMQRPFLRSTKKWLAPGHPSVTVTPDGRHLMFLHAYFPGQAGYKQFRALLMTRLQFDFESLLPD